jgi:phosphoribosylformimino-5-aminoimidazole carboxamide ribotide isomerase
MILFPAVDVRQDRLVRLREGNPDEEFSYRLSPLAWAEALVEAGATFLHMIDLGAAFGEAPSTESVRAVVRNARVPVQVGGGIRTLDRVGELIDLGAHRLIMSTRALQDPSFLEAAVARAGADAIVIALDFRGARIGIEGWRDAIERDLREAGERFRALGLGRLLVTAIERDGTFEGPDVELWRRVAAQTGMRVMGAGGIGSLDDIRRAVRHRFPELEGVVIGRALVEGRLSLPDALRLLAEEESMEETLDLIKFDSQGLVPAVVQDAVDGTVLMVAYMNRESLRRTLAEGRTCFWSRSRQEFWVKGATSGNTQEVVSIAADCDNDCLLVKVRQKGVACHTGARSCFFRSIRP